MNHELKIFLNVHRETIYSHITEDLVTIVFIYISEKIFAHIIS